MADEEIQAANDAWQTALYEVTHRYSEAIKALHESNPWPESSALDQSINLLATELWDRCFSLTDIASAFTDAAHDLPRYAAGAEIRP